MKNTYQWDTLLDDLTGTVDCPEPKRPVIPVIGAEMLEVCRIAPPDDVPQRKLIEAGNAWCSAWQRESHENLSAGDFINSVRPGFDALISAWREASIDQAAPICFMDRLAAPLQKWFRENVPELKAEPNSSLSDLATKARIFQPWSLGHGLVAALEAATLEMEMNKELEPIREGLRLLAKITDLPLFITTTPDHLFEDVFVSSDEDCQTACWNGDTIDVPEDWVPGRTFSEERRARLFYLFGRIDKSGDCAITDADKLEALVHLFSDRRPSNLLSIMKRSHLLFIGTRFPHWLWLAVARALRGTSFEAGKRSSLESIAEADASSESTPVTFLKASSATSPIYYPGGAKEFVRQLYEKWNERKAEQIEYKRKLQIRRKVMPVSNDKAGRNRNGSIFISYTRDNKAQAENIHKQLDGQKLPVWRDVERLNAGAQFPVEIQSAIRECALFVPLLSRDTIERRVGWFRQEWKQAKEQRGSVGPGVPFIIPLIVDSSPVDGNEEDSHANDVQNYFTDLHVVHAPNGILGDKELATLINDFKKAIRARTR